MRDNVRDMRRRRCTHPSRLRRIIARLAFMSPKAAAKIVDGGAFIQKLGHTIRFEHFWRDKVASDANVVIIESFARSRTKHPIWDIALERAQQLGTQGTVLEFGTNNGGSLLYFHKHLPSSMRLVGFDSFEGIPEPWDSLPRGAIKGYGAPIELWSDYPEERSRVLEQVRQTGNFPPPPQANVTIEVGLFAHSLPRFLRGGVPADIRLIHFDADIYMATRPVLDTLCAQLRYRYLVLFDEFYSANHEFRAWMEFVEYNSDIVWKVLAISEDGVQALFEISRDPCR